MAAPAKKASLTQTGGAELKRFVVQSTLLYLIDPVRGEPTRTSLSGNLDDNSSDGHQLKQKFLDSFALICSTSSSGAETASAVCLEQHDPAETILRVARNRGLAQKDLNGLETVLQILQLVARKEKSSTQAEQEILRVVAELDKDRILALAEKIEQRGIRKLLLEAQPSLLADQVKSEKLADPGLISWLKSCPFRAAAIRTRDSATVIKLVEWASQARSSYSETLQSLVGFERKHKPPWVESLHKIARYHIAITTMVRLAMKQPGLFTKIHIKGLKAADQIPFCLKEKGVLPVTLKNLVKEDSRVVTEQLEKHLGTLDVEAQLRKKCQLSLTLHAEMQLVVFYEENPSLVPRMPFIGTSKKACFLCHEYLFLHPLGLRVSACHQKIYPSWMPPPFYKVPGKYKNTPFVKLSRKVEQLTKRELRTALNAPRRPRNLDSTAGPSLTIRTTVSM